MGNKFSIFTLIKMPLRWDVMICKILQTYFYYACFCEPDMLGVWPFFNHSVQDKVIYQHSLSYRICILKYKKKGTPGLLLSFSNLKGGRLRSLGCLLACLFVFSQGKRILKEPMLHLAVLAYSQILSLVETNQHTFPLVDFLFFIRKKRIMFVKSNY